MTYLGHIKGAGAWNAGKARSLAGVRALNRGTVRITLDKPITYFLETLTFPTSWVLKAGTPPGAKLTTTQSLNVGTGPFTFGKPWRYRQEMYLIPNPYWYNAGKLQLKEIDIPFVSTSDLAYREYQSGQIPMAQVPTAMLASVRHKPDFHSSPTLGIDYLSLNQGKNAQCKPVSCAPFNDLHFRRALRYAINRDAITHTLVHDEDLPLCGLVPRGIPGYDPSLCSLTPYDPAKAKAELALARKDFGGTLPNEGRLTLYYLAGYQKYDLLYTELQSEWSAVDIDIKITALPVNHWIDLFTSNYTPILGNSWIDDYPDAQDFCEYLLNTASLFNAGNYHNPRYDQLMTAADVTPNGPARTRLYIQAQQIAINDVAFIALGQTTLNYQYSQNIHGMTVASSSLWPVPVGGDWTNVRVS
jgi:peptide/nickel transport system substrate-binding protein/oligopeptide transport system substrate-binding protein